MKDTKERSIYIHIPFCEHRCNYCDFFTTGGYEQEKIEEYCAYLIQEIDIYTSRADDKECSINSVYFGGGTPSYASEKAIARIMKKIHNDFNVLNNAEITIEVNPRSAIKDKLNAYREAGINRLSIGIQSQNKDELNTLERIHSADEGLETVRSAREAGFDNISIDFMYGTPGQTLQSWEKTLESVKIMDPEHVSAYSLMLEEGTRMTIQVQKGELVLPESDTAADMFELANDRMKALGYDHYELSNYSKPGFESRHNLHYWEGKPYIGFGMSSHWYDGTTRYWNSKIFSKYYEFIDTGTLPIDGEERLTKVQQMNEVIMLSLRLRKGLSLRSYGEKFGSQAADDLSRKIELMLKEEQDLEFLNYKDGQVQLTTKGFYVSDEIISKLLV